MGRKDRQRSFLADESSDANPFSELAKLRGSLPKGETPPAQDAPAESRSGFAAKVVIRKERSGRGGKTVTVIQGVLMSGKEREDFVRHLKKTLGTSGTVDGDEIVLGGDVSARAARLLEAAGATRIIMGN